VWLTVDRNRNKIINIAVSKSREKTVYIKIAQRLDLNGYKVKLLCIDGYEGYASYNLTEKNIVTKAEHR
jgi:hypothetical protein